MFRREKVLHVALFLVFSSASFLTVSRFFLVKTAWSAKQGDEHLFIVTAFAWFCFLSFFRQIMLYVDNLVFSLSVCSTEPVLLFVLVSKVLFALLSSYVNVLQKERNGKICITNIDTTKSRNYRFSSTGFARLNQQYDSPMHYFWGPVHCNCKYSNNYWKWKILTQFWLTKTNKEFNNACGASKFNSQYRFVWNVPNRFHAIYFLLTKRLFITK